MNSLIDPIQREGLEAFCETVVGGFVDASSGFTISQLADRMDHRIALLDAESRRPVREFIRRLTVWGGLWSTRGGLRPFSRNTREQRERQLQELLVSRHSAWSGAAQSLYRQAVFLAAMLSEPKPDRATAGHPKQTSGDDPVSAEAVGNRFETSHPRSGQTQLACEWLVIGSGPAGSIMAAELAELGHSVLLVDQGSLLADGRRLGEAEANRRIIETFGAWNGQRESVILSAGRTFGGGSVVNWGTCVEPPEPLLEEWSQRTGFDFADHPGFRHSLFAVRRRLQAEPAELHHPGDQRLKAGAEQLGIPLQPLANNTDGCGDCSGCQFGCSTGQKRDMRTNWLVDASRLGAHLLPECRVKRLILRDGAAQEAEAEWIQPGLEPRPLKIQFRHCVLAAGAIHTPTLLHRSGYSNPHLGQHLAAHPSVLVPALYPQPQTYRGGPIQSFLCDQLKDCAAPGYGVILENAFFSRGLAALTLPWRSGSEFGNMLHSHPHWSALLVLARDRRTGSVRPDRDGRPVVRYQLGRAEREALNRGVGLAWQLSLAAGAHACWGPWWSPGGVSADWPTSAPTRRRPAGPDSHEPPAALTPAEATLKKMARQPMKLWSAHQMGTCRMADSPMRGVVNPRGQVFGLKNVFVCDSSLFPTPAGVNPMLTIAALSHFLAQQIKASL